MSNYTHTVLITGGTQNMGYHCALTIARQNPNYLILIASRTDPNNAANTINQTTKNANVQWLPLDLGSLTSVRNFATSWKHTYPPISSLIMNAGLQFPGPVSYTLDGIEKTFAINHVGHALLFHLLTPYLAPTARIVVVSSGTHDPALKTGLPDAVYETAEELAHPSGKSVKVPGRQRYSTSKLVNVLWTYALARRFQNSAQHKGKTVVAFDPGFMPGTGLARDAHPVGQWIFRNILPRMKPVLKLFLAGNVHTPQESGENLAVVGMGDVGGGSDNGKYYEGRKVIPSSKVSYDVGKQEDLWGWTVGFVAGGEEERGRFDGLM